MTAIAGLDVRLVPHLDLPEPPSRHQVSGDAEYARWRKAYVAYNKLRYEHPHYHDGIGVEIEGVLCEFLSRASRTVYVDRTRRLVAKVADSHSTMEQSWIEVRTYHEVLDDEARAMVPPILGMGACEINGLTCLVTIMEYVDFVPVVTYGGKQPVSKPMQTWRAHVAATLQRKFQLADLHGRNLGFTTDGAVCLVDLGYSSVHTSELRSPAVIDLARNLPEPIRERIGL